METLRQHSPQQKDTVRNEKSLIRKSARGKELKMWRGADVVFFHYYPSGSRQHTIRRKQRFTDTAQTTVDPDEEEEDDFRADDDDRAYKNPRNFPSTHCPRDEEYAVFMGQKCLRKCYSDEDCKSKRKRCLCDGLCGMSCVKPDRECEELSSPSFGQVTLRGLLFGDKANYTCELGYMLVGPRQRTCQADGTWSGSAPLCKQTGFCTTPPLITNARHNVLPEQTAFDIGDSIEYQCTVGFVTNGFPTAKCLEVGGAASWFGPDISCEPRSCGNPTEIPHGWHTGDCYIYGCRITYRCEDGYEMVGKPEKICLNDGSYSPKELPACVPVQCSIPENPLFGTALYTSTSYNSVVSYDCKYGYNLVGEVTRRCGADRKWSGSTPKCKEINCGSLGPLYNGWMENVESGAGLGAAVIFHCDNHMLMEGSTSSICQSDGTWRYPPPLCLAPCVVPKVQLGRLFALVNETGPDNSTSIVKSSFEMSVVQHGTQVVVECNQMYEPANSSWPVICNNGTWSYIPKCQPARCKHLPATPQYGFVMAFKMEHGGIARFRCKDGYYIQGHDTAECKFGNWTVPTPQCLEKYCPYPGTIANGKVLLVGSMGQYDYRPYVRKVTNDRQIMYECNRGFVLENGPPGATCVDGRWRPTELPKCVISQHPQVRLTRSVSVIEEFANKTHKGVNELLLLRVRRALSGQNTQVMRSKQQTSVKDPKEKSSGSGNSRKKSQGYYGDEDDIDGKDYEDETTEGNEDEEKKMKKKKKNKSRKRKVGPCIPIPNEPYIHLEVVKPGRMSNISHSHGTVVKIICANGYRLNVAINSTTKCVRGKWKPEQPKCDHIPCVVPFTAYGSYSRYSVNGLKPEDTIITEQTEFIDGEIVNFTCNLGFDVNGPTVLKCVLGEWDVPKLPECTPAPCILPPLVHGKYLRGQKEGLHIANGTVVAYQCGHEFVKAASVSIECFHGELLPRKPSCKRDAGLFLTGVDILRETELGTMDLISGLRGSCGPPTQIEGSLIFKNGEPLSDNERSFPDGTEVTFHCIGNFVGEKLTWRIICSDGSWMGRSFSCDKDDEVQNKKDEVDNSTCTYRNTDPNVVTFHEDKEVVEPVVEFPAGTVLTFRCSDIGKYALEGSNNCRCKNGEWDSETPICVGLNQEYAYALEKPPTILFRHEEGPIAQSNDGKLIVYPGTVLHMECLWLRRFGTPKWNVSHSYRNYTDGWTTDPKRDNLLEFRLTIDGATVDDSGVFSCMTPTRHMHSVEIVVEAVHCDPINGSKSLIYNTTETKMNTRVQFSCANENTLTGVTEVTCMPSGNWSADIPTCETVECPPIENMTDPNLRVTILSNFVGGYAAFSCVQGYGLHGPQSSTCLPTGEWKQPFPTCSGIQACSYPGTVINGQISSVKFYYAIGEIVTFLCEEGFELQGSATSHCLNNGKWSHAIPACMPPPLLATTNESAELPAAAATDGQRQ